MAQQTASTSSSSSYNNQQQPGKFTTRTSFRTGNGYNNRAADRREAVNRKQARRAKFAQNGGSY